MAVIQGIEQLESKLAELERVVRRKMLTVALKEAAEITRARAADLAPVLKELDKRREAGRLKAHEIVSVSQQSDSNTAVVRVGPDKTAFYGLFEEIGTAHATADPFLGPAYEETKEEVLAKMSALFIEAVNSV